MKSTGGGAPRMSFKARTLAHKKKLKDAAKEAAKDAAKEAKQAAKEAKQKQAIE